MRNRTLNDRLDRLASRLQPPIERKILIQFICPDTKAVVETLVLHIGRNERQWIPNAVDEKKNQNKWCYEDPHLAD